VDIPRAPRDIIGAQELLRCRASVGTTNEIKRRRRFAIDPGQKSHAVTGYDPIHADGMNDEQAIGTAHRR
jgi:hypothetical protein